MFLVVKGTECGWRGTVGRDVLEAESAAVAMLKGIPVSWVRRKRLGKYGDLERLLASVLLSPLGDARGVVVRQHFCGRSRRSSVVVVHRFESGIVIVVDGRSPIQWLLWFPVTGVRLVG